MPTAFLLVAMTVFTLARFVFEVPVPIERVIVFDGPHPEPVWRLEHAYSVLDHAACRSARMVRCCRLSSSPGLTLGSVLGVVQIDQAACAFKRSAAMRRGILVLPVVVVCYLVEIHRRIPE